jgi:predicted nicotinamide N-methyase
MSTEKPSALREPFMVIEDTPVFFEEDWSAGIGGGLWSTGLAMAQYAKTTHAKQEIQRLHDRVGRLSVLELGSGNGLLATCWLALAASYIEKLVISDDADHLPMIRQTLCANKHLTDLVTGSCIHVLEHTWGSFEKRDSHQNSYSDHVRSGECKFDLILGSDVAYRPYLYDPLISSLLRYSKPHTISLIGVTMQDTRVDFFHKLTKAGFTYRRLADHLFEPQFRGTTFGIFVIQKQEGDQ